MMVSFSPAHTLARTRRSRLSLLPLPGALLPCRRSEVTAKNFRSYHFAAHESRTRLRKSNFTKRSNAKTYFSPTRSKRSKVADKEILFDILLLRLFSLAEHFDAFDNISKGILRINVQAALAIEGRFSCRSSNERTPRPEQVIIRWNVSIAHRALLAFRIFVGPSFSAHLVSDCELRTPTSPALSDDVSDSLAR